MNSAGNIISPIPIPISVPWAFSYDKADLLADGHDTNYVQSRLKTFDVIRFHKCGRCNIGFRNDHEICEQKHVCILIRDYDDSNMGGEYLIHIKLINSRTAVHPLSRDFEGKHMLFESFNYRFIPIISYTIEKCVPRRRFIRDSQTNEE